MLENFSSCCNSSWPLLLKLQMEEKFCKDPVVWMRSSSCNEKGEKVFPVSFIFSPVKFSDVFLQSMLQNKSQMLWRAVSHPQSSP